MPEEKKHPKIELCPCESSQIHSHGHDPATNTLALQFKSKKGPGAVYHYPNVTAEDYSAFCCSPSKGKYFGANIKGNAKHPHTRLPDAE